MRLIVDHRTVYRFSQPQARVVQILRMTPSDHAAQTVVDWRIDVSCDARLKAGRDGFGNCTHMLYIDGPVEAVELTVHGEVLTEDSIGIVGGGTEPLPPLLFTRATPLTLPSGELSDFARDAAGAGNDPVERLHRLNRAVAGRFRRVEGPPDMTRTAADSFVAGEGVARDIAHVFIAAARAIGAPARLVCGHYLDPRNPLRTAHSWAEAHVDGLGWVGFDPCAGFSPDESYIRVAVGLDASYATPVSGARVGEGPEEMEVNVRVDLGVEE